MPLFISIGLFVYRHDKYAHLNTAITSPAGKSPKKNDKTSSASQSSPVWKSDEYATWLSVCSGGALSATHCQSWSEMTESLVGTMDQLFPDVLPAATAAVYVSAASSQSSARRPSSSTAHSDNNDDSEEEEDEEEFEQDEDEEDDYDE